MIGASLVLQKALRMSLVNEPQVTVLVPATSIFDRHGRPETFPCIVMGEDQEIGEDVTMARNHTRVFATLHVFDRSTGMTGVKNIAGAVRFAVRNGLPALDNPYVLIDIRFDDVRLLRDPDGITAHAVVTFEALVERLPT